MPLSVPCVNAGSGVREALLSTRDGPMQQNNSKVNLAPPKKGGHVTPWGSVQTGQTGVCDMNWIFVWAFSRGVFPYQNTKSKVSSPGFFLGGSGPLSPKFLFVCVGPQLLCYVFVLIFFSSFGSIMLNFHVSFLVLGWFLF